MYYGQLIGLVIAVDPLIARRAAKTIKVSYDNLPAIVTIEEAIKSNSFFDYSNSLTRGMSLTEAILRGVCLLVLAFSQIMTLVELTIFMVLKYSEFPL